MKKNYFSVHINASPSRVWDAVIGDQSYREWTEVFSPGSHFKGSWAEGSKIYFLAPNEAGEMEGMSSVIVKNTPHEFISIQHVGFMRGDVEDTESDEVKKWTPAYENYLLKEVNGGTEFQVEIDVAAEYENYFQDTWPLALNRLKQVAEGQTQNQITVQASIKAPLEKVWDTWVKPEHIMQWCAASADWEVPYAENDLREGGTFKTTMAAKDKSMSFDFEGTYTGVRHHELIQYEMSDGRKVTVQFIQFPDAIKVIETFDADTQNPAEAQRMGWQSILDNFKQYVGSLV